jgi:hypothetical protein
MTYDRAPEDGRAKGRNVRQICDGPDRDVPRIKCGHPIPCPYHTVIIDASVDPATVTIPVTSPALGNHKARKRLGDIAVVVSKPFRKRKGGA